MVAKTGLSTAIWVSFMDAGAKQSCHPERSEGPLRPQERSLAALGMTARLGARHHSLDAAALTCTVVRFLVWMFGGIGTPRFSRNVLPSYWVRKMPRRCSSGMTIVT